MAWSWSHTQEAYVNAKRNLSEKSREWLISCWAEIQSRYDTGYGWAFDSEKYNAIYDDGWHKSNHQLIKAIWDFAYEFQTCDNGGYNAYMCPFGCHTVPFGKREENEPRYHWD